METFERPLFTLSNDANALDNGPCSSNVISLLTTAKTSFSVYSWENPASCRQLTDQEIMDWVVDHFDSVRGDYILGNDYARVFARILNNMDVERKDELEMEIACSDFVPSKMELVMYTKDPLIAQILACDNNNDIRLLTAKYHADDCVFLTEDKDPEISAMEFERMSDEVFKIWTYKHGAECVIANYPEESVIEIAKRGAYAQALMTHKSPKVRAAVGAVKGTSLPYVWNKAIHDPDPSVRRAVLMAKISEGKVTFGKSAMEPEMDNEKVFE